MTRREAAKEEEYLKQECCVSSFPQPTPTSRPAVARLVGPSTRQSLVCRVEIAVDAAAVVAAAWEESGYGTAHPAEWVEAEPGEGNEEIHGGPLDIGPC